MVSMCGGDREPHLAHVLKSYLCTVAIAPLLPFLTALSSTSLNLASLCQGIAAETLQQSGVRR